MKHKHKQIRNWLLFVAVLVIVIGGLIYLGQPRDAGVLEAEFTEIKDTDNIKGNKEARVVLIEYSDFQCPACASFVPTVNKLVEELGEDFVFVYRHFPLRQIHDAAQLSAQAAEAAGLQGKFWEMHDILFERQSQWGENGDAKDEFISYAEELGLDIDKFGDDLTGREVKDKVNSDYKEAISAGLQGTPTFFIDGEKINKLLNYEGFKALIQAKAAGSI